MSASLVSMLAVFVFALAGCFPGGEIPMGSGACDVPMFIGQTAQSNPLAPSPIPPHPYLAGQGKNGMHSGSYCTGTYPWSGPLGSNPQVTSLAVGQLGGLVATVAVDTQGRLICVSGGLLGFKLLLLDPVTLQILAGHPLPQRPGMSEFWRTWDWTVIMSDTSGGAYFHLDSQDRPIIANANRIIQVFRAVENGGKFAWQVEEEYDLNVVLPEDAPVTDAMPDWDGWLWFVTRTGIVGVVNPANGSMGTLALTHSDTSGQTVEEEIQNAMAIAEDGVYIVSDHALYRFERNPADGSPQWTWREEYDRGTYEKPGAVNQGSGTTPTLLGDELIAITDNADVQDNVLIYKRLPGVSGNRLVCQVPIFDPNFSVSENSLIGYDRSVIVENNYLYSTMSPIDPDPRLHPGVVRIDVDEGCTDCEIIWQNTEVSSTTVPKLSIGNGLIYLYTRLQDTPDDIMAWYLTALDFETGAIAFKIFAGTGIQWNNSYAPTTIGPDGTAYVGVFNGIIAVRDGDQNEPPRDLGCN